LRAPAETAEATKKERQMTGRIWGRGAAIAACLLLATCQPLRADPAPVIHYAPAENLEHIDVALIDRAEHEIG
jgi:hypothetical protein